jgi:hypothetical protein
MFPTKYKCSPREVSIFPLFYQGDVRWENQLRRHRNRQNFVVGSYFPMARKSRKNSDARRFEGNLLMQANLRSEAKERVTDGYRTKWLFPG